MSAKAHSVSRSDVIEASLVDGVSKTAAAEIVTKALNYITASLVEGNTVQIHEFGSLSVQLRSQRTGRNPSTGEPITIPAKRVVKFKPSTALRTRMNAKAKSR